MSDHKPPHPICTVDPYQYLQLTRNPDGTIIRNLSIPTSSAEPDPATATATSIVVSKDVLVNQQYNTWLRIYLPRNTPVSSSNAKLPLVVYYHGGGFILASAASTICHDFCCQMASRLPAVIVSVEYRLAPEHRLPAAYEDAMEALHCIRSTHDEWFRDFADYKNCFLMGTSAGGNMAYHAGLLAAVEDLEPLKIRGLILHHPFFGGSARTGSEVRLVNDPVFPLSVGDLMWELGLPVGADRDHEYANPMLGGGSYKLDRIMLMGWRVLVTGFYGDPLIDRQIEFVKMLERKGARAVAQFGEGGYHGYELMEPANADPLFLLIKDFINGMT